MQVNFNQITSAKKEVVLTVEPERVQSAYKKYLNKSAGEVEIQGFRKGKAPLSMVERVYGERIRELFEKDFVDEVFTEASQEHDIHYLLYPEIKEITWEPGSEMTVKAEIETEPVVNFTQVEGLRVPYKPLELKDEVEHYIAELRKENATVLDVEKDIMEDDEVEFEASCTLDGKPYTQVYTTHANPQHEPQITEAALGKKVGDTFNLSLPHGLIHHIFKDAEHTHHDGDVETTLMVNAIRRTQLPVIDDDFAKDLEFDSVVDMHAKIAAELAEKNVSKNENIRINALITKLYIDNRFDLPEQTIQYLAQKELDQYNISDAQWRKYYEFQIRYQITQDFINMYLMNALRKQYSVEPTEEDIAKYMEHEAKLGDQSIEEWKEKHKEAIGDKDFKETVANYMILHKIADTCEFFIAEDPVVEDKVETVEAETQAGEA